MPKIRQKAEEYAQADFLTEIAVRMCYAGVDSYRDLAAGMGITPATMCRRKKEVDGFCIGELKSLVRMLKPDMGIMLRLLGYTDKEINRFAKVRCGGIAGSTEDVTPHLRA